jgi:hypothetical protein
MQVNRVYLAKTQLRLLGLLLLVGEVAVAQQHPPEPTVNLGETSFLDARGGPGWMVEEIGDGSYGNGAAGMPGVDSVSGVSHVVYVSKLGFLGANLGGEVLLPVAHVSRGNQGVANGVGDLTVSPFILQWKELRLRRSRLHQRFVFDFDLPTGEYDAGAMTNLSSNTYRIHPYYAFTFLPSKRIETSWRTHYLWNSTDSEPPVASQARSTRAGEALHFNATLSASLPHGLWIGANGYFLKQVTAPQINGASLSDSNEEVGAIGPGLLWDRKSFLFYINTYKEFGATNRPQGSKLVLRAQWIPGKSKGD